MYESLIRTLRYCWADIGAIAVAADALEAIEACNNALREQLSSVTAERDALLDELNGICWSCAHAEAYPKGFGGLSSCKYLREQNILATAGKRKCTHWEWRGRKEKP